jgi:hypothetical protein
VSMTIKLLSSNDDTHNGCLHDCLEKLCKSILDISVNYLTATHNNGLLNTSFKYPLSATAGQMNVDSDKSTNAPG